MKEYEFSIFDYDWEWDDTKKALRVTERKQTPEEWVDKMLHAFGLDHAADVGSVGRYTYAYDDTGRTAKACCADSDKFDSDTGIAIAYARLRNLPIHPTFKPIQPASPTIATVEEELLPLRYSDEVRPGSRVYNKTTKKWGTVDKFSPDTSGLVAVRWDGCSIVCSVPKGNLKWEAKRRS